MERNFPPLPHLKLSYREGCRELAQDLCMQAALWMGLVLVRAQNWGMMEEWNTVGCSNWNPRRKMTSLTTSFYFIQTRHRWITSAPFTLLFACGDPAPICICLSVDVVVKCVVVLSKSDFVIVLDLLRKQREKNVLYYSSNVFLMLSRPINNLKEVTISDCH